MKARALNARANDSPDGALLGLAFLFYPEVIARGNKAAETVSIPGLLSAGAQRVLRRAPAEAQGAESGGAGLALDVPDTGLEDAAQ